MTDAVRRWGPAGLPSLIPFLDSYDEAEFDAVSWNRFVHKAARGSIKAADWMLRACSAVVAGEYGLETLDAPQVDFERLLTARLPEAPPFADWQEFVQCLRRSSYLSPAFSLSDGYCADRSIYDARWSKFIQAQLPATYPSQHSCDCLIYDAALHCFQGWSKREFLEARARVSADALAYNSLDVVSAMLFLMITWTEEPVWGRLLDQASML